LRKLRQTSNLPAIFLTSKDDEIDEVVGFNIGADDFIRKPCSTRLLAERVKAILRRSRGAAAGAEDGDKKPIVRGRLTLDPNRHACQWDGEVVRLTVTEFRILQALAQRPGYVKSRDQLMDAAYDDQVYVDDRTIDSHIKRLRKKFRDIDDNFDSIETLYGVGYRYKEALHYGQDCCDAPSATTALVSDRETDPRLTPDRTSDSHHRGAGPE